MSGTLCRAAFAAERIRREESSRAKTTRRGEGENGAEILQGTLARLMEAPWWWIRFGFVRASFCKRESRRAGEVRHVSTVTLFDEGVKRELLWRMGAIDDECREKKKRLYHTENQEELGGRREKSKAIFNLKFQRGRKQKREIKGAHHWRGEGHGQTDGITRSARLPWDRRAWRGGQGGSRQEE
jgi:hypothetical protein